jgi:cytochrome c oxidase assembly protein subunit 11
MPSNARRTRTALICAAVAVGMTGAAFAAVPLYKAFCQATGFAGTARRASSAPAKPLDRELTVYFDTNVNGVPWSFKPVERSQKVKVGGTNIAFFKVVNNSDRTITGRAAYSVSPDLAGAHVRKLQCFCFTAQTLGPRQSMEFPVIYFIDPKWVSDPDTRGYEDVTLSYTFVSDEAEAPKKVAAAKTTQPLGAATRGGL